MARFRPNHHHVRLCGPGNLKLSLLNSTTVAAFRCFAMTPPVRATESRPDPRPGTWQFRLQSWLVRSVRVTVAVWAGVVHFNGPKSQAGAHAGARAIGPRGMRLVCPQAARSTILSAADGGLAALPRCRRTVTGSQRRPSVTVGTLCAGRSQRQVRRGGRGCKLDRATPEGRRAWLL